MFRHRKGSPRKRGKRMSNEWMQNEVQEAIYAGEKALRSLQMAREKLNSARNWGIADLFGGGFFMDMMKHSKLSSASAYLDDAKRDLHVFQRELRDVQVPMNFGVEIGEFLSFADFFFDGLVADYLVQSKISEARDQVEEAIFHVSRLLNELKMMNG